MHSPQEPESKYDLSLPWNDGVRGTQVLPLINDDTDVLRVQAGPGTGKTFGLRRRVLRLLHPKGAAVPPERVLVCSFNRIIAKDLTDAITEELKKHNLALPKIRTVHGLCAELTHARSGLLLPEEVEAMVFDVRKLHPVLNKRLGGKQAKVLRALREHEAGLRSHPDLAQAIGQWLVDHGAELIGDLPRQVERRMANGELAFERYDHIIVDEFQDLTDTEARLLVAVRANGGSLIVLGDQKQSIYAFRGNDKKGLQSIPELVGDTVTDH